MESESVPNQREKKEREGGKENACAIWDAIKVASSIDR